MKTFRIHGGVVGSKYLGEIEAETAQEALERAPRELDFDVNLCHQCSDQCEDPEVDKYVAEAADGDESSQVDGFWEGRYYKAQARVLELEQHMAKALSNARAEALEEAAKAVEDLLDRCVLVDDLWRHPEANPKITTLSGILKTIRNPDVTKQSDS